MSRIGKMPVALPNGVSVTITETQVSVKGPKGQLQVAVPHGIRVAQADNELVVERLSESRDKRAKHGLVRSLVANAVSGVSQGFERVLEIIGVGYRAEIKGKFITFNLGLAHPIWFEIPEEIEVDVTKAGRITIKGIDKQKVGQIAANIRALRPPEPYKGKGIKYVDETVRHKVGKAG